MRFEVKETSDAPRPWTWWLVDDDGEVLSRGESFESLEECLDAIGRVKDVPLVTATVHADSKAPIRRRGRPRVAVGAPFVDSFAAAASNSQR